MTETSQHVVKITGDISQLQGLLKQLENSLGELKKKALEFGGAWLSFEGAKKVVELAARFEDLRERIALTVRNQQEFNQVMNALFGIAQRTGTSLEEVQKTYANIAAASQGFGISQKTLLAIIENVNKAVRLSGGGINEINSAIDQFVKAITQGDVSGRQFIGILNSSSVLTKVLADAITNGSVPALKQMATEGNLTTQQLLKLADPAISDKINRAFSGIANGSESGLQRVENAVQNLITKIDQLTGLSNYVGESFNELAKTIEEKTPGILNNLDDLIQRFSTLGDNVQRVIGFLQQNWISPEIIAFIQALKSSSTNVLTFAEAIEKASNKSKESNKDFMDLTKGSQDTWHAFTDLSGNVKDLSLQFGGLIDNQSGANQNFHKLSQEAQSFSDHLRKLKDDIDLKTAEKLRENLNAPLDDADKIWLALIKDVEENKKAFDQLGSNGKKSIDAIRESLGELKKELQTEKNIKFMEMADEEINAHQKQVEEDAAKPFIHAMENIQDAFASGFEDIFRNGVDSFGDLATKIKDVMIKAAAEIAAALVFKPILASTTSALLGSVAPDLARTIIKGMGVETTPGSNGLGVTNPLTSIASHLLGSSSIFSSFNASVASALPSLFSSGATVGGITGTAGTTVGQGLLTGLGISPAAAVLGIAAIAIPLIAGMFGGGTPHPGASFGGTLTDSSNAFQGYDLRAKHMDTQGVQQLAQALDTIFQNLGGSGINLGSPTVQGRIDSNGKAQFGIGSGSSINWMDLFNPGDADALDTAIKGLMKSLLSTADITNKDVVEALKNVDWEGQKVQEILDNLNFASTFEALRNQLNQSLNKDLVGIFDPALKEISDENDRYATQLALAKQISGDVATVERLHQERLDQIRVKYSKGIDATSQSVDDLNSSLKDAQDRFKVFGDMVKTLSDFSTSLKLGNLSPLSAQDKYRIAQETFNQTASLARLGNADAMKDLPKVAQDFLTISREFNAGSGAYTEDFNNVQKAIDDAKAVAERQMNLADTQVQTLQAQLAEMQKQTDLLQNIANSNMPSGYSYGAKYLEALANPQANNLINTSIGENLNTLNQRNFGWGDASGLEVRALGRAFGYSGDYGTGLFDKWLQANVGDLLTSFNDALTAIGGTPRFRASGGMVSPGFPYIVGESGPERFVPNVQGRIVGATEAASMLSGSYGGSGDSGLKELAKEIRITNNRIEALQKQVNNNLLFRRVA